MLRSCGMPSEIALLQCLVCATAAVAALCASAVAVVDAAPLPAPAKLHWAPQPAQQAILDAIHHLRRVPLLSLSVHVAAATTATPQQQSGVLELYHADVVEHAVAAFAADHGFADENDQLLSTVIRRVQSGANTTLLIHRDRRVVGASAAAARHACAGCGCLVVARATARILSGEYRLVPPSRVYAVPRMSSHS